MPARGQFVRGIAIVRDRLFVHLVNKKFTPEHYFFLQEG